ncbi:MAG: diguanylate cyclase [Actinomycetota bacterium]|nr:diguanylate cyclase [Actinomycetota bacterium]
MTVAPSRGLSEHAPADSVALPRVARVAGAVGVVIGATVMAGWVLDSDPLKRVAPGLASMKFNTALCIVALGAVLVFDARAWIRKAVLGGVCAVVLATLVEYALEISIGIDELIFDDAVPGTTVPGRMAVSSAACFLLLVAALANSPARYSRWRQGCAATVCTLGWIGLLGYIFGASDLYTIGPLSTMALHTAVAMLVLAVGVLATIEGGVLVRAVRRRDAGAFALGQFLPLAVVGLPALAYLRLEGQRAGWYNTEFGLALMVTASSLVVCFVAMRVAGRLTRSETDRNRVLAELEALNVDLERRVDERTNDLAVSEAWAHSLSNSAPIGIFRTDASGSCTFTNERWQEISGIGAAEALGSGWTTGIHPADRDRVIAAWNLAATTETDLDIEFRGLRPSGEMRWVRARAVGVIDGAGNVSGYAGTLSDTTDHRIAEEQFRTAFDSAPIGMALIDQHGKFLKTNEALRTMVGCDANDLLSVTASELVHPDELPGVDDRQADFGATNNDRRLVHANGTVIWASVRLAPIVDQAGETNLTLVQVIDITEQRRAESELFFLANHDPLTGLQNRRSFEAALEAHIARAARYGAEGALLFLDIDHFKAVNDSYGHQIGDQVIAAAANALRVRLRRSDVIARIGGDEFAVLLPTGSAADVRLVADMLVRVVRADIAVVANIELGLTISVGLSLFDVDGRTADEMLMAADVAMYEAKERGRDQWAETSVPS